MKSFLERKLFAHDFSSALFISCLTVLLTFTTKAGSKMDSSFSLLCLGDSYTIGESVLPAENFPNQTVALLKKEEHDFETPEIVAQTGWTTDELLDAISKHSFKNSYDFVTLLIGVNNQYRGGSIENYKVEFESLLRQAIPFANGKTDHVIVLSIPDWSVTPFARDRNRKQIAKEIDDYNAANKNIAEQYKVNYIDITPGTRQELNDPGLLAGDGLHPSEKEYAKWAEKTSGLIKFILKR
jgi:lysophospholipase L1-like esterase